MEFKSIESMMPELFQITTQIPPKLMMLFDIIMEVKGFKDHIVFLLLRDFYYLK